MVSQGKSWPSFGLQQLDEQRLWDFLSGAQVLSAADPDNRMTEDGGHNQIPILVLVERLRIGRLEWVSKLEALGEDEAAPSALHPRLHQFMRVLDWMYFVASTTIIISSERGKRF